MAKVAWMRNFWKSDPCYAQDYGVNGTVCSFLIYLSEVENWCPLLPGRIKPTDDIKPDISQPADLDRQDVEKLLALLNDKSPIKFEWIKNRIRQMWPDWIDAMNRLKRSYNISKSAIQKKILIHIGVLANERTLHFAADAKKGGPLGELVQWSDLIATLYLLGHDILVTADVFQLKQVLGRTGIKRKACPTRIPNDFDLIYLDYYGIKQIMLRIGQLMPYFKCKFRILDSFGTEAQFNYAGFTGKIPGGRMGIWGRHNLNLLQFMTMFPHSPDNSFLGFVVGKTVVPTAPVKKKKPRALVYGKHHNIWREFGNRKFLDTINKYLEIHATIGGLAKEDELKKLKYIPEYVINHGVISPLEVQKLLQSTMVFVGLGFPYEGPAPLEAIANGCFFLNPKYDPPKSRLNTQFFRDKPTLRKLTSQHPYAEEFISEPHVYTVNIGNTSAVETIMRKIMLSKPVKPYLPFEFTHEGMLERVHKFIQNQDFCGNNNWPPRNIVKPTIGELSKSCKETCHENGMVCEPHLFQEINSNEKMTRAGFPCNTTKSAFTSSLVAPGYRTDTPLCLIQAQSLLYSCTASSPTTKRLCPCREFRPGQVALCKTC
ncbi:Alpha-1,6-mannosylglycoprotein 6-beta-N-acetylglucosaminyltransferase A [Exaiptasia diaphana]|nr:Alpha-1,6-mannosylglycoprotein 6-beta-N-acetylglucosaminyltransferase A [Exaiptasia diaphana]